MHHDTRPGGTKYPQLGGFKHQNCSLQVLEAQHLKPNISNVLFVLVAVSESMSHFFSTSSDGQLSLVFPGPCLCHPVSAFIIRLLCVLFPLSSYENAGHIRLATPSYTCQTPAPSDYAQMPHFCSEA